MVVVGQAMVRFLCALLSDYGGCGMYKEEGKSRDKPVNETALRLKKIIDMQSLLVSMKFDLGEFMQTVAEQVQAVTSASGAVVELIEGNEMVYRAASGTVAPYIGLRLASENSLSGLCVRTGEMLISADTASDPRVDAAACRKVGAASMLVVPLRRLDSTIGVVKVVSDRTHAFDEYKMDMLHMMTALLGAALGQQLEIERRRQLEVQLSHMAQHDTLTELPNRALFTDRLEQALARRARNDGVLALMYFDIDHFKVINDSYGHSIGDALLRAFAIRVKAQVRAGDTLARLGGDEFALVAEDLRDLKNAEELAAKIITAMRDGFMLEGHDIRVSTSIGIALVFADTQADVASVIHRADLAMYAAKKAGRNTFQIDKGT